MSKIHRKVTARLVTHVLGVDPSLVRALPMDQVRITNTRTCAHKDAHIRHTRGEETERGRVLDPNTIDTHTQEMSIGRPEEQLTVSLLDANHW